jgi:DNA-binding XRE family transcriptional regulator
MTTLERTKNTIQVKINELAEDNSVITLCRTYRPMPRPTPPERQGNPIQRLRRILAIPGNKDLSQAELAPIVDISKHSLNSIECDRVKLSRRMQDQIKLNTGAVWHEKDQCWRFWEKDGPTYCRDHYRKYSELMMEHAKGIIPQLDIFFATTRIRLLLETLPPRKRAQFLFRLNTFLSDSQEEFCPDNFLELFLDACGRVGANPELNRNHPMRVLRFYYPRILRHLPDKKKLEEWSKIQFDVAGYEKMIKQERARDVTGVLPHAKKKRQRSASSSRGG